MLCLGVIQDKCDVVVVNVPMYVRARAWVWVCVFYWERESERYPVRYVYKRKICC